MSVGFNILRVKRRLVTKRSYNYNTNQPLLYIIKNYGFLILVRPLILSYTVLRRFIRGYIPKNTLFVNRVCRSLRLKNKKRRIA